jgi:hypothetical protein
LVCATACGYKEERTACTNRIRGVLTEFGLVFAQSPKAWLAELSDVLEDASNELPGRARVVLQRAFDHWRELDEHLRWCDRQVGQHVRSDPAARRANQAIGIGEIGASVLTARLGDFKQFGSAKQFGAWLGIVPRQNSSGGKTVLGRITKRGDDYLSTLLIQGAKAAVMSTAKRDDPISRWLVQLTARVGWQKACVAMANKNARILWAMMTREQHYDAGHVSVKPEAKLPAHERTPSRRGTPLLRRPARRKPRTLRNRITLMSPPIFLGGVKFEVQRVEPNERRAQRDVFRRFLYRPREGCGSPESCVAGH